MENEAFRGGDATTAFLAQHPDVIPPSQDGAVTPGSVGPNGRTEIVVEVNNRRFTVSLPDGVALNGDQATATKAAPVRRRAKAGTRAATSGPNLTSPIQGVVLRVAVEPGQQVTQGALVCVVEAMKMENEIVAHRDGVVTAVPVQTGASVGIGAVLATIEAC